jgi:amino acid permease
MREHFGITGQALLDIALIINSTGVLIIALVVVGDILVGDGTAGLLSEACGSRQVVLAVVTVVLIAPLVSVTSMRSVAGASALGVAAVIGE